MPELPEVETTRRGIAAHVRGRRIADVIVREARLRWPVPPDLARLLIGSRVESVDRRAKYLLFRMTDARGRAAGTLIGHLGMSGSLRIVPASTTPQLHDHVDLLFDGGRVLRLRDPRRFGSLLFTREDSALHPLLRELGPEPLSPQFDGGHLAAEARGRSVAVKSFVMDSRVVVGVGNIYASEALWRAAIHPRRPAGRISRARFDALAAAVKSVLQAAIRKGGTTLRDFVKADGEAGYFRIELDVYGRASAPCRRCATPIRRALIGQRSAFFCPRCQR